jgi:hypothetical protein
MEDSMENKYATGAIVVAKVNPERKLIVRRYVDRIYFCTVQGDPSHKDLAYFERELLADPA